MRRKKAVEENVGELNLVPYMDIMVNLIIFMLFTMSGFLQMKVINVSVPAIDNGQTSAESEPTPPPEKKLAIVLAVLDKKGFVVSLSGKFMLEDGTVADALPPGQFTVPNKSDGSYDYDKLKTTMEKVKVMDPSITALTIVPEKSVDYNTIIKSLDAIRRESPKEENKEPGLLYPDILLGIGG